MTTIFGHYNVLSPKYQSILYFDSCKRKWLKVYHNVFILLYLEDVKYWGKVVHIKITYFFVMFYLVVFCFFYKNNRIFFLYFLSLM
jgi:hypothetical protein